MPELEVSSGSFLSQIVALDLTIRPPKKSLAAAAAKHPLKSPLALLMHTGRVQHPPHLLPQSGKEEDHPHQGQPGEQGQPPPAGGEVLHAL